MAFPAGTTVSGVAPTAKRQDGPLDAIVRVTPPWCVPGMVRPSDHVTGTGVPDDAFERLIIR